jgi:8-amino-7-oxononanoate synthase
MPNSFTSTHARQLTELERAGRKRALLLPKGIDFSSNDYLGLAQSGIAASWMAEALELGIGHGSGGSRLLGGNHAEHVALEECAAEIYGAGAALFFSSGYNANLALFSTLPQRGDLVLYDALIHASAHDGMRLGRAETRPFAHNDLSDLETQMRGHSGPGRIWVAAESLYSMDGDRAPLTEMMALCDQYQAMLVIDEAHAVGVFGDRGIGLSGSFGAQENVVVLRTCGKALGVEGAIITCAPVLRDFLVNRARPFIFSTAPSPMTAFLVRKAIEHVATTPELQHRMATHIAHAESRFGRYCPASAAGSQIFPVIVGEDIAAMAIAAQLQAQGFDVRGIRPPTVPAGTARLRISLTLNVTLAQIDMLAEALIAAFKKFDTGSLAA